jgi:hypothetical protein
MFLDEIDRQAVARFHLLLELTQVSLRQSFGAGSASKKQTDEQKQFCDHRASR